MRSHSSSGIRNFEYTTSFYVCYSYIVFGWVLNIYAKNFGSHNNEKFSAGDSNTLMYFFSNSVFVHKIALIAP